MIRLFYKSELIPPSHYIFHYASNNDCLYKLHIDLREKEIIEYIEKYVEVEIYNSHLLDLIKSKDFDRRSMGLLWSLKVVFFDKMYPQKTGDDVVILSNIKDVKISEDELIIIGG